MVNQEMLEGTWNQVRGKIRQKWGQLTDSDLSQFKGNVEQLVGIIQRKTGAGREAIEQYLQELTGNGSSAVTKATETVREYAQNMADTVQDRAKVAADQVRAGYVEASRLVRDRPAESLAICFGMGLVVGILIGLSVRSS